jgi:putative DNA-invertase from lambdoid prophage Rac
MVIIDKVGYSRVSTRDQDPENQVRILQNAGIPQDYIFIDRGISGTMPAEDRPGFQRAMKCIEENKETVKFLYVYEISRLGRTTIETVNLIEKLERRGIMIWSLSPKESFTQSSDKNIRTLLLMIMSWVAERERDNLIERTRAGLDRARSEGKILGRPKAEIDFCEVGKMRSEGKNWDKISKLVGYPVMTIYRARKRRGELVKKEEKK